MDSRIRLNVNHVIICLLEKDDFLSKLGGESNRLLAKRSMKAKAFNFFANQEEIDPNRKNPLNRLQAHIKKHSRQSHVAIAMVPLTMVYEEGTRLKESKKYNMLTSLHLGESTSFQDFSLSVLLYEYRRRKVKLQASHRITKLASWVKKH